LPGRISGRLACGRRGRLPRSPPHRTVCCRAVYDASDAIGILGSHLPDPAMKFRGNFVLKPEALAECARAEVLRVADEEDRAKPQRDRLVCAGHRRNRLQYVKSGLAIATTPAEAARSLLPFRSVVASPAFRACRSLGPPDRFQSTQADPFCLLGAFGFRTFPAQSDGIGEFQPIQIVIPHRAIIATGQKTTPAENDRDAQYIERPRRQRGQTEAEQKTTVLSCRKRPYWRAENDRTIVQKTTVLLCRKRPYYRAENDRTIVQKTT
jgi:hypothetical protein